MLETGLHVKDVRLLRRGEVSYLSFAQFSTVASVGAPVPASSFTLLG